MVYLFSSLLKGLFSSAISQSGSVVLNPGPQTRPIETAKELGQKLNCSNVDDTKELNQCLLNASAEDIVSISLDNMLYLTKDGVSQDENEQSQIFMPDYAINLLDRGEFKTDIPWILGVNSAESYFAALGQYLQRNNQIYN